MDPPDTDQPPVKTQVEPQTISDDSYAFGISGDSIKIVVRVGPQVYAPTQGVNYLHLGIWRSVKG